MAASSSTDIGSKTKMAAKLAELWPTVTIGFGVILSVLWSAGLLVFLLFLLI
jgi:hypothetical protein